ncbi:hypothetical protein B0J15DRAFT_469703 [Fusarium solani]|uniref:MFS transporter n=1 Tax=Fusarium solani TaxID=169388 RepID=A0A9P9GST9_FUSSL|nr:uncharacterized protein B0J15DRAFT_469703 [Fusarium solani]KAH7243789.1 hypothetical protein B0J15DRAFT_469703 [Fusarium solani]
MSGVRNLPLIRAATIATIVSGASITNTGIYAPILIGYQVLAGLAWGAGIQVPMIATQGTSKELDLAFETAILLFFQIVGGAFLVGGQTPSTDSVFRLMGLLTYA